MKQFFVLLQLLLSLSFFLQTLSGGVSAFELIQPPGLGIPADTSGSSPEGLVETIVVNVLNLFFTVGGVGVVIYFVWGAVDWILSGGDKEKVASARKKMTNSLIGLVLLSLSFVLINIIGQIVGFNPLGYLQLRSLDSKGNPIINQSPANQ